MEERMEVRFLTAPCKMFQYAYNQRATEVCRDLAQASGYCGVCRLMCDFVW